MHQKINNKEKIELYLKELGFNENNWGFLSGAINDIEFTLMGDPLFGYTLSYKYLSPRTIGIDEVILGKELTVKQLQLTMENIQNVYKN